MTTPTLDERYECHLFVCVNTRPGDRPSCADSGGTNIREALKHQVKLKPWHSRVRVSGSLCLGACTEGPNAVIYPQGIWFHKLTEDQIPTILSTLEELLEPEEH